MFVHGIWLTSSGVNLLLAFVLILCFLSNRHRWILWSGLVCICWSVDDFAKVVWGISTVKDAMIMHVRLTCAGLDDVLFVGAALSLSGKGKHIAFGRYFLLVVAINGMTLMTIVLPNMSRMLSDSGVEFLFNMSRVMDSASVWFFLLSVFTTLRQLISDKATIPLLFSGLLVTCFPFLQIFSQPFPDSFVYMDTVAKIAFAITICVGSILIVSKGERFESMIIEIDIPADQIDVQAIEDELNTVGYYFIGGHPNFNVHSLSHTGSKSRLRIEASDVNSLREIADLIHAGLMGPTIDYKPSFGDKVGLEEFFGSGQGGSKDWVSAAIERGSRLEYWVLDGDGIRLENKIDIDLSSRLALIKFLTKRFDRIDSLREFVACIPGLRWVCSELPQGSYSASAFANEVVSILERHRLIEPVLFDALETEFPETHQWVRILRRNYG